MLDSDYLILVFSLFFMFFRIKKLETKYALYIFLFSLIFYKEKQF